MLKLTTTLLSLNQIENPWEGIPPEEWYEGPSLLLWVFGWIFLSLGLLALMILIVYTKYGRETSIKLSIITVISASIFLGLSFHFFLLNAGF
ncbi:MAG: hypothetical protein ACFFAN_01130 [Promethearchaeota archaeon]